MSRTENRRTTEGKCERSTKYYNILQCSYYDDTKGECKLEIERRCHPSNKEWELKENDKIMLMKNKNGLVTYLYDGEHTRQEVIDNSIKSMVFLSRVFCSISLFLGFVFLVMFVFGCA